MLQRKHKIAGGVIAVLIILGTLAVHVAGNKAAGFVNEMADRQTVLQGKLQIGHFSASVSGNVVFENVVWTAPDGKKLAEVPEMNVSANLFDILKGSFGINSINSISIEKPQFAVNYTDKDGLDIINYINFSDKDDETPTEFRGMVEITDGALALNMNGQKLDFSNVEMQANLKEFPDIKFTLQGKNGDADLIGSIDKVYDDVTIGAEVKNLQITELMKVLPSFGELSINGGVINGAKLAAGLHDAQWNLNLDGSLSGVAGKALGYNITDGGGSFAIDNNAASFTAVKGKVEGQDVNMDGKILFQKQGMPTYDLNVAAPSFRVDAVSPGMGITDSVNINGKVTGPIDAPVINGSFTMDKLEVAPLVATGINGNYNYTNGLVTLSNTYANVYSGTLGVSGTVEAATKNFALHLSGSGMDSTAVTETQISGPLSFEADASGTGSADSAVAGGTFVIAPGNFAGVPFNSLSGNFSRANGQMTFSGITIGTPLGSFTSNAVMNSNGKITFDKMSESSFSAPTKEEVRENVRQQVGGAVKQGLGKLFGK